MKQKKITAKDQAFAKERSRFLRTIKAIKQQLHDKDITISKQADTIRELNNEIHTQQEWIDRLLEYMDMTPDDLNAVKAEIRLQKDTKSAIDDIFGIIRQFM